MIILHDATLSPHAWKVRLLLSMMELPHRLAPVNLREREHKTPEYLTRHPFGQVPLLSDGNSQFWDSHGILVYLASKHGGGTWLPRDPEGVARVASWLSVSANEVHNSIYQARNLLMFSSDQGLALEALHGRAERLFGALEAHLAERDWLAAESPTVADVALYPGWALAPDAKFDTVRYGHVRAWATRFQALPGYRPMLEKAAA